MFETGVCVPALKFDKRRAKACDYFDFWITYAMILAGALSVLDAAMLYMYPSAPITWLRAIAFCSYLIIVFSQIWDIFYQCQKLKYGYSQRPSYYVAWVILRLALIVCFLSQCPGRYGDFAAYWAHVSLPNDLMVVTITLLALVVVVGVVISTLIIALYRVIDQRLWRVYIDSEYDINETPPTFIEYCQKVNQ